MPTIPTIRLKADPTVSRSHRPDSAFKRSGWVFLAALVVFLAATALSTWHRLGLPDDMDALYLDTGNATGLTTSSGATIVAIEGQPAADMLARALTLQPRPPEHWAIGQQVTYTLPSGNISYVLHARHASFERNPSIFALWTIFLAISLFAFVKRPQSLAARLLLAYPVLNLASEIAHIPTNGWSEVTAADLFSPFAYWPTEFFNQLASLYSGLILLHFFLVFPVPKTLVIRRPRLIAALLYGLPPALTLALLGIHLATGQVLLFWARYTTCETLTFVATISIMVYVFWHSFATLRDPIPRAQFRWIMFGAACQISAILLFFSLISLSQFQQFLPQWLVGAGQIMFEVLPFSAIALPITIAIALLRYHLFDIDIIINRTLVYGALTAVLGLVYIVCVVALQALVFDTGLSAQLTSTPVVVVSTLAAAAIFTPLRRRIQRVVDRRFYREQVDFRAAFTAFAQEVRTIISLPELLQALAVRTTELLHSTHSAVYLRAADGELRRQTSYGLHHDGPAALKLEEPILARLQARDVVAHGDSDVLVPLTAPSVHVASHRQLVGVLALGPRLSGQGYRHGEQSLLLSLADQAGTAIAVAQLVEQQQVEAEARRVAEQRLEAHRASPVGRAEQLAERLRQSSAPLALLLQASQSDGDLQLLAYLPRILNEQGQPALALIAEGLNHLAASHNSPELLAPGLRTLLSGLERYARETNDPAVHEVYRAYDYCRSLLAATTIAQVAECTANVQAPAISSENLPIAALVQHLEVIGNAVDRLWAAQQVASAEDRIGYLVESIERLNQAEMRLRLIAGQAERAMLQAIVEHWLGLIGAVLRETQTRPRITATLLTRHIWQRERLNVRLALHNSGRGTAQAVTVAAAPSQEYRVVSAPVRLTTFEPGATAEIELEIELQPGAVPDQLHLRFPITTTDLQGREHLDQVADSIMLMIPSDTFRPIPNPYVVGAPLRAGSPLFVGRSDLLQFIQEHLAAVHSNHLVLIGQRRTGKTSLLKQLPARLDERVLSIYLDGQALGLDPGLPNFFLTVATEIAYGLEEYGISITPPELSEFLESPALAFERGFLARVRRTIGERRLVLLLDEFEELEAAIERGTLDASVFTILRHLIQHTPDLCVMFCGTHRLEELTSKYWSTLFNIALYRHIGFLSHEDAMRLVCEPVNPGLRYDDLALDKIWRVTSGQPYFLQLLCYTLVSRQNKQRRAFVTIDDVTAAVSELLATGEAHFAYLWAESGLLERQVLAVISHRVGLYDQIADDQLVDELAVLDLRPERAALNSALRRLVLGDILSASGATESGTIFYRWKLGLLGLWIGRVQPLSRVVEEAMRD